METIVTAVITGVVTILVCLINNKYQQRKHDEEQDKRMVEMAHQHEIAMLKLQKEIDKSITKIEDKIDELDKKQAIHNSVIDRVYALEKNESIMEEKIKVANNRIADLEKNGGK